MIISEFDHWRSTAPRQRNVTWAEFCDEVIGETHTPFDVASVHDYVLAELSRAYAKKCDKDGIVQDPDWVPDPVKLEKAAHDEAKKRTRAFSPVEYANGGTRGNDDVVAVHMAALDFDNLDAQNFADLRRAVDGLAYAIYSSFSHPRRFQEKGTYSFRLIFPLEHPIHAAEWPSFWSRFKALWPAECDESCKDPARLFGLPFTPVGCGANFIETRDGELLPIDRILQQPGQSASISASQVSAPEADQLSQKDVLKCGQRIAKSRNPAYAQIGRWIINVAKGEAWCSHQGDRHGAALKIGQVLDREFRAVSVAAIAEVFRPSVSFMDATQPDFDTDKRMADIERQIDGARQNRFLEDAESEKEREKAHAQTVSRARRDGLDHSFTAEELAQIAAEQNCAVTDLKNRWILQKADSYYFLSLGGYFGPCSGKEAMLAAHQYLAPAPVELTTYTPQGEVKNRPLPELTIEYGQVIGRVVADMTASITYLRLDGAVRIIHEAVCPLRAIEPKQDPEIDRYLCLLGGSRADKLLDWLATVTLLNKQTCAIYLVGAKGAGKGLLARGVARLWTTGGPTELARVLENFNEDLTRCPVAWVDEAMPKRRGGAYSSAEIRSFIGSSTRTLSRKFVANADLIGCARLIVAGNNDRILDFREDMDGEDVAAVSQRITHIRASKASAEYLNQLKERDPDIIEKKWIAADAFAAHLLWLRNTRVVKLGSRFLVEGEEDSTHTRLIVNGKTTARICEWLAGYTQQPKKFQSTQDASLIQHLNGQVLVNVRALVNQWELYCKREPGESVNAAALGRALRLISVGDGTEVRIETSSGPMRFRAQVLNAPAVLSWIEDNGYGDLDRARAMLLGEAKVVAA